MISIITQRSQFLTRLGRKHAALKTFLLLHLVDVAKGFAFHCFFVYIFVNSLVQRISNLILLNDFAFCFFRFR